MNSTTVNDKNPFTNNKMESMCIVCTKDLSQCDKQKSKLVKTVLPDINPPTKVFEALKLLSDLSVANEKLRVCLLCFHKTLLALRFQLLCNQSAANIKACIDNQTVEESDEAPDKQELNKNETNDENFFNSMKVEDTKEEIVVTSFDTTVDLDENEEACAAVMPEFDDSYFDSDTEINQKSSDVESDEFDLDDDINSATLRKRTVWDTTKVQCSQCHKMFGKKYLKVHMRTHTGEMPFECKICEKGFPARTALRYHMRTHEDKNHYLCTFCGQAFRMVGNLNKHIRIHTGERPYSCEICGKTFTNSGGRNMHRTMHSDEKPFACDECPKRFSNAEGLRKHKVVHLKVKPLECMHCGVRFTMRYNLKVHLANSCKGIRS